MENNSIKTFSVNGKLYAIPQDKVGQFQKEMPGAIPVFAFEKDGKKLGIPTEKVNDFLSDVPGAKPLYEYPELKDMFKSSQQPAQDYTQKPDSTRTLQVPAQTFQEGAEPSNTQDELGNNIYSLSESISSQKQKLGDEIYKIGKIGERNAIESVKNIFRSDKNDVPLQDYEGDNEITPTSVKTKPMWDEYKKLEQAENLLTKAEEYKKAPSENSFKAFLKGLNAPLAKDLLSAGLTEVERNLQIAKSITGDTNADQQLIKAYKALKKIQENPDGETGWTYQTGEVVSNMIPYMIQFALTRGGGTAAKASVNEILKTAGSKGVSAIAKKGAAYTAGAMGQAVSMPMMYGKFGEEIAGGKDYGNAFLSAFMKTTGETFGERFGEVGSKLLTKTLAKNAGSIRSNLMKAVGWNGPWEYLEENVTNAWNTLFTDERELKDFWNWKEQGVIALSTMIVGGPFALHNHVVKSNVKNSLRKAEDKIDGISDESLRNQIIGAVDVESPENTMNNIGELIRQNNITDKSLLSDIGNYAKSRIQYNAMFQGKDQPQVPTVPPNSPQGIDTEVQAVIDRERGIYEGLLNEQDNDQNKPMYQERLDQINKDPLGYFTLALQKKELLNKSNPSEDRQKQIEELKGIISKLQPANAAPADPMQQARTEAEKDFDGHIHKESGNNVFVNHSKLGPIRLSSADIDQAGNVTSETGEVFAWDPNSPNNQIPISLTEIIGKPVVVSRDQYLSDALQKVQTVEAEKTAVDSNSYTDEAGQRWMITGQQDEKGNPLVALVDKNNKPTNQIKPVTPEQLEGYMQKKQVEEAPVPEGEAKPVVKTATWGKTKYQYKSNQDGTADVIIPNNVPASKAFKEISEHFTGNSTEYTVVPLTVKKVVTNPNDEFADKKEVEVTTGVKIVPKGMAPATPAKTEDKGAKQTAQPTKQAPASYSFGKDKIERDEAAEIVNLAESYEDIKDLRLEGDQELQNLIQTKFPPVYLIGDQPTDQVKVRANIRLGKNLDQITIENDSELSNLLAETKKKFTGSVNKNQKQAGNVPQSKPVTPSQPTNPVITEEQKSPINESTPDSELTQIRNRFKARKDYIRDEMNGKLSIDYKWDGKKSINTYVSELLNSQDVPMEDKELVQQYAKTFNEIQSAHNKQLKAIKGVDLSEKKPRSLSEIQQRAIEVDAYDIDTLVKQYFINGGKINKSVIEYIFGDKSGQRRGSDPAVEAERKIRIGYYGGKENGKGIEEIAHELWEMYEDITPNASDIDYRDAIISVVQGFSSTTKMAQSIVDAFELQEKPIDPDVIEDFEIDENVEAVVEATPDNDNISGRIEAFINEIGEGNNWFTENDLLKIIKENKDKLPENDYLAFTNYLNGIIEQQPGDIFADEQGQDPIADEADMGGNDLPGEADGRKEEVNEGEDKGQLREGPELGRKPEEVNPPTEKEQSLTDLINSVETDQQRQQKLLDEKLSGLTETQRKTALEAISHINSKANGKLDALTEAVNAAKKAATYIETERAKQGELFPQESKPFVYQGIIIDAPKDFSPENIERTMKPLRDLVNRNIKEYQDAKKKLEPDIDNAIKVAMSQNEINWGDQPAQQPAQEPAKPQVDREAEKINQNPSEAQKKASVEKAQQSLFGQEPAPVSNPSDIAAKKADIERRRQEELNRAEQNEVIKAETYEAYNQQTGEKQLVQVRTTKGGKKEIFIQGEGIQEGRLIWISLGSKYSSEVGNDLLLRFVDDPKLIKTQDEGEFLTELKETFKGKTKRERIDEKYDAELEAISSSQQVSQEAANVNQNPSPAQKEAGNYKKGHVTVQGMDISIENPAGSKRSGTDKDGNKWERTMTAHYGYFKRTDGKDGDQIDTFINPDNPESDKVFVVDQNHVDSKDFDESKVMLGYKSYEEAKEAYLSNYEDGWVNNVRAITEVPLDQFKRWLYDGARQRKPFGEYKDTPAPVVEQKTPEIVTPIEAAIEKPVVKENLTTEKETPKEYRYKMLLRPFDIGTHPKEGFIKVENDPEGGFQILTYDRKLDRKQWNQFSLLPITEIGEIKGKGFKDKDGEYTVTLKWENNNQWAEVTMLDKNGDLVSDPYDMSYMDILENIQTGYWVENKKSESPIEKKGKESSESSPQEESKTQGEKGEGFKADPLRANVENDILQKLEDRGYIATFYDNNANEVTVDKATELRIGFTSDMETYIGKTIKLPKTKQVDVGYILDQLEKDNTYKSFADKFADALKKIGYSSGLNVYPTTYGIGVSVAFDYKGSSDKIKAEVKKLLDDAGIKYDTEYSDARMVYRYKISKAADNIERLNAFNEAKPQRFDEGKKLTEEEKREVYRTLKDAYKVNNRPRTLEDQGQGERWMWLENATDYMVTSDITGAKLRWFVTLPDGKIAHPTELWPSMDRAEIERVQDSIERQGYYADKKYNETLTELKKNREEESIWDNIDRALKAGAEFIKEYSAEDRGQRNPNVYLRWKHLPGNTSIPDYHLRFEGSTFAGMNQEQYINAKETGNKWTRWENADIDWERFYNENKPLQTPLEKVISQNPVLKLESPESIEKLEDFGDKIGGARKDMGITRTVRDEESLPAWRRKYYFIPTEGKIGPEWKIDTTKPFFVVYDVKDSYNRKFPRKITSVGKYEPRVFTSEEEAEAYIPIFEVGQQRFRIRKSESGFKIVRVSSTKKLVEYATFPTEEEANAFMYSTEGATSLLNHRREDFSIPKLDKVERTGKDWRKGKDVTTDEFMNTFGFRGGEFGNWVKPEERRVMLNAAYDSFIDLSELLNIPPRAVSLGGELAIAFGARGIKGAAAHFEPDRAVINMTRMNGAGSLAHEWAHAMDSYFGMQEAKSAYEKNEKGQLVNGGKFLSEDKTYKAGMRNELSKIFDEIVSATQSKTVTRVMGVEEKQKLFDLNSKLVNEESNHIIKKFEKGIIRYLYNRKTKQREETLVKATPEQLEKVKEIVDKIRNGEGTTPEWNRIPGSKGIGEYSYISPETLALEELHKEVFGKSGLKRDGNGFFNLGYYANKMYPAKKAFEKAKAGETETVKVKTDYLKNSIEFDASRSGPYFQKKVEMFARAFEYFIEQKLLDKNQRADYLQYDKAPVYEALYGMSPYPAGEERAEINKLFQKFFDEVKVVDRGGVSFMQRVVSTTDKKHQFEIIQSANPAQDDIHTWIRDINEIQTLEESVKSPEWNSYEEYNPDWTAKNANKAIRTGKVTVYSSKPIEAGTFVTPSKMEAQSYSVDGKVYSQEVNTNDVAWIDPTQGQYAPAPETFVRVDDMETVRGAIQDLQDKATNAKPLFMYSSDNELNKHLDEAGIPQDAAKKVLKDGKTIGFYDEGRGVVFIDLRKIGSVNDGVATWVHEMGIHAGLRNIIPAEQFDSFMEDIYDLFENNSKSYNEKTADNASRTAKKAFDIVMGSSSYADVPKAKKGEEMMAYFGERYTLSTKRNDTNLEDKGIFRQIVEKITNLLRKVFGLTPKQLTLEDVELIVKGSIRSMFATGTRPVDAINQDQGEGKVRPDGKVEYEFTPLEKAINKAVDTKTSGMVEVDGVMRPTTNSQGNPIATTLAGIRNFYKWFGDSKVVDEQGRPLVVYHGTKEKFTEFRKSPGNIWFTPTRDYAESFGKIGEYYVRLLNPIDNSPRYDPDSDGYIDRYPSWTDGVKGGILAIAVKNPNQIKSATGNNGNFDPDDFNILRRTTPPIVTPLENVVQNAADRYAENRAIKRTWNETRDQMKQFWKDIDLPIKRLQEEIVKLGGKLTDNSQPYRAIDLAKGRMESLYTRYLTNKFNPILKAISDMRKIGISGTDILPYMISKHALERNPDLRNKELNELVDKFKKSNPDATQDEIDVFTFDATESLKNKDYSGIMPFDKDENGKSINGFENPEELAQSIVDEFEARFDTDKKKALLKALWDANHEAGQETLKIWNEGNSMSKEEYEYQQARYKNFVPLRGWREGPANQLRYHKGHGFGKSLVHAEGRTSLAENPLAYMKSVAFKALGEQVDNEVRREMLNLLLDNWKVKGVQKLVRQKQAYYIKVYDAMGNWEWDIARDADGELVKPDQSLIDAGEAKAKVYSNHEKLRTSAQAKEHEVWVRTANMDVVLVFDNKSKDMLEVAHAFNHSNTMFKYMFSKNVGDAESWNKPLASTIGIFNNWQKAMYTSFNVVFPFTNFGRDIQEATLTQWIKGESGTKVIKNYKNAFPAIIRAIRDEQDLKNNDFDKLYERFYLTGGITGFTHSKDIQQIEREVDRIVEDLTNKGTLKGAVGRNLRHLVGNVETWNRIFEDATRFSVFMAAVESGKTDKEAASLAKEASVNFNRKGKITKSFDSVWAFFNVALESMFKNFGLAHNFPKRFWTVAGGYAAAGFIVTLINDMLPGDDDDDYYNVSDYARRNYLILPNIIRLIAKGEKGDKYLRLPLPQFWRGFFSAGSLLYDVTVKGDVKATKAAGIGLSNFIAGLLPVDITGVFSEEGVSFSPIAPTVTKPVIEMLENRNFMGQKIYNEPFTLAQKDELAGAGLGKSNVNQAIKFITDLAFVAGGGEKEIYRKMKVDDEGMKRVPWIADWNPSKIEHILKGYTGGTGGVVTDAVTTAVQIFDPDTPYDFRNTPFINAFIRKVPEKKWKTIREYQEVKSEISDFPSILRAYKSDARLSGNTDRYKTAYKNRYLQEYSATIKVYDNVISNLAERVDYKTGEGMDEMVKVMNDAINKVNAIKEKYDK